MANYCFEQDPERYPNWCIPIQIALNPWLLDFKENIRIWSQFLKLVRILGNYLRLQLASRTRMRTHIHAYTRVRGFANLKGETFPIKPLVVQQPWFANLFHLSPILFNCAAIILLSCLCPISDKPLYYKGLHINSLWWWIILNSWSCSYYPNYSNFHFICQILVIWWTTGNIRNWHVIADGPGIPIKWLCI